MRFAANYLSQTHITLHARETSCTTARETACTAFLIWDNSTSSVFLSFLLLNTALQVISPVMTIILILSHYQVVPCLSLMTWQGGVQSQVCRSSAVSRAQGRSSRTGYPLCERISRPTKQNKTKTYIQNTLVEN